MDRRDVAEMTWGCTVGVVEKSLDYIYVLVYESNRSLRSGKKERTDGLFVRAWVVVTLRKSEESGILDLVAWEDI